MNYSITQLHQSAALQLPEQVFLPPNSRFLGESISLAPSSIGPALVQLLWPRGRIIAATVAGRWVGEIGWGSSHGGSAWAEQKSMSTSKLTFRMSRMF